MKDIITKSYKESILTKEGLYKQNLQPVVQSAEVIADAFKADRKLLICGNGGSAADAQHIAAEFVNRFMIERPPLPAVALSTDTSIITSIGNDYSFDQIFSKQVKAIGLTGKGGGKMAKMVDMMVNVDSDVDKRIQELDSTARHIICDLIDHIL